MLSCFKKSYSYYDGANSYITYILNSKPIVTGITSKIYNSPNSDNILKYVPNKNTYLHEKEIIDRICGGCKYILNDVTFYDNSQILTMPKYDTDVLEYLKIKGPINTNDAVNMCLNISTGLFYIHTKKYIYGDLKPENVCLKNGNINEPIIIDLGSCHRTNPTTTLETASPEALRNEQLTYTHDLWTLGIFFMEITTLCFTVPNKVMKHEDGWVRGPNDQLSFLNKHPLFLNCTKFIRNERCLKIS